MTFQTLETLLGMQMILEPGFKSGFENLLNPIVLFDMEKFQFRIWALEASLLELIKSCVGSHFEDFERTSNLQFG